ncbi:MAG: 2-oxo acid dehydrogenase subunit E2 [Solirubrobacterales bacterium]
MSEPEGAKGKTEVMELSKLQQSVARRVAESKATIPHAYVGVTIAGGGDRPEAQVIRAAALALREHPRLNAAHRDGKIELYSRVNVAFPVSAQEAVLFPTVLDADGKEAAEIAAETERLAARARDGSITAPETAAATFTVFNLGGQNASRLLPVIQPPQAAALGMGSSEATLACDGRILYGPEAAAFLRRFAALLENPEGPAS